MYGRIIHELQFFFLNMFYLFQRGSNGFITEKTIISQESNIFQGGGGSNFFQGGGGGGWVRMLNSIETHRPYNL